MKGLARNVSQSGEVEDVSHWLLRCPAWDLIREPLSVDPLLTVMPPGLSPVEQTARILSVACTQ